MIVRWARSHGAEILVDVKDAARCRMGCPLSPRTSWRSAPMRS
jgi:hypothetical protein